MRDELNTAKTTRGKNKDAAIEAAAPSSAQWSGHSQSGGLELGDPLDAVPKGSV